MFTVFVNTEKVFCIYMSNTQSIKYILYLYLAMYRVFVFVIGILMLVFDPSLLWCIGLPTVTVCECVHMLCSCRTLPHPH